MDQIIYRFSSDSGDNDYCFGVNYGDAKSFPGHSFRKSIRRLNPQHNKTTKANKMGKYCFCLNTSLVCFHGN